MKISINLLPPEVTAREIKRARFYKIQFIGVSIILFMIFLTSLTLALQILQSRNTKLYQAQLTRAEEEVSSFKNTQASLFLLQNRLSVIKEHLGVSSKQVVMYRLIDKLIPSSVAVNAISLDKGGDAVFLALAPDALSLDTLITNLVSKDINEDKISEVSIESLNRGRDGVYRISFKIKSR